MASQRTDDINHAVEFYIDEVNYLVTLPDYSEEDVAQMLARQQRLAALTIKDPVTILDQHIPSITDEMDAGEGEWEDLWPRDEMGDYIGDKRVCRCGVVLDGFYEYVDHLKEVLS
jgi:hypothetical protein